MQWNKDKNAGFTQGNPWIRVNPNYIDINVEDALKDKNSIFYHYKELIKFRKNMDVVVYGDYELLYKDNKDIYSYLRNLEGKKLLVVCNFFDREVVFEKTKHIEFSNCEILLSNYYDSNTSIENIRLRPYEAIIYRLTV